MKHKKENKEKNKNYLGFPSDDNSNSIARLTDEIISGKSSRSPSPMNNLGDSSLGEPISGHINVLLAEKYSEEIDPKGYLLSEKLDGIRCFWNGKSMFSRNGNR